MTKDGFFSSNQVVCIVPEGKRFRKEKGTTSPFGDISWKLHTLLPLTTHQLEHGDVLLQVRLGNVDNSECSGFQLKFLLLEKEMEKQYWRTRRFCSGGNTNKLKESLTHLLGQWIHMKKSNQIPCLHCT